MTYLALSERAVRGGAQMFVDPACFGQHRFQEVFSPTPPRAMWLPSGLFRRQPGLNSMHMVVRINQKCSGTVVMTGATSIPWFSV